MTESVNIIIPSVNISDELIKCLKEINKIIYKNFYVTIVLDKEGRKKLPKSKFKINKLIVGKINMSKKRNLAAKKFKSKYIAFIDSDAYPNKKWLFLSIKYLKKKKGDIVGGPGIPFSNQKYLEKISYLSKRSFFVTGYLNFRKYKAKSSLCDWLESCNLVMRRDFFLKYRGMDVNRYTGEDKEFFERVRKQKPSLKVFYSPDLFIYHRERSLIGFLLQRSCFGMDFVNLIKTKAKSNKKEISQEEAEKLLKENHELNQKHIDQDQKSLKEKKAVVKKPSAKKVVTKAESKVTKAKKAKKVSKK